MIGAVERLSFNVGAAAATDRDLDYDRLLYAPVGDARRFVVRGEPPAGSVTMPLDERLLPALDAFLAGDGPASADVRVSNTDRAVGACLSARIYAERAMKGLGEGGTFTVRLTGSAGQSFGVFATSGLTLSLTGETNDYAGKGLSGGRLVIRPPTDAAWPAAGAVIAGNVCLFGATSGEAYFAGRAGERFAVRNSGAVAVVEGVGDHGCEYMTGGVVAVLGPTGVNFAAGMSGGLAYVLDADGLFDTRCNLEMVDLDPLDESDAEALRDLLERHVRYTDSSIARTLLADWSRTLARFVKVFPMEYRRVLGRMTAADAATPRPAGVFA
jgi:glutamate synthase domain-containing protein 3